MAAEKMRGRITGQHHGFHQESNRATDLKDDARLLEKNVVDLAADDLGLCVSGEIEPRELAESRRIVVSQCLGIAEGFEELWRRGKRGRGARFAEISPVSDDTNTSAPGLKRPCARRWSARPPRSLSWKSDAAPCPTWRQRPGNATSTWWSRSCPRRIRRK